MNSIIKTDVTTSEIKIIGAGFGRTGTFTTKTALEELGFGPCYHMTEVLGHPDRIALWYAAATGETANWKEVFQGYQATVDWPACTFYKELMEIYPDAKVLLTVRDPEKWYESAYNTIFPLLYRKRFSCLNLLFKLFVQKVPLLLQMLNTLIWDGTFHGRFTDKEHAIEVFNQHIEGVKKHVPPERLLIYNVKEGWEPLCTFLGVEVPQNKPFPHLNDRATVFRSFRRTVARKALVVASIMLMLFLVLRRLREKICKD